MRYLDPLALARLKNLRFKLRGHRVEGQLTGRHRSLLHGFSQEFAEHRAYVPGDELKRLDWKAYARRDRLFIKEFQEEKSLRSYLVVDASGSMAYRGSGSDSKWEIACRLAVSLAYLVLAQSDAAGLLTFDTEPRAFIPPRQAISHLELVDDALAASRPGGETDLGGALRRVAGLIPRRSRIVLISDLLGDPRRVLETLKAFSARKHPLSVLQVLDPAERSLDYEGPTLFESLEGGETLLCEAGLIRQAYREAFERQQRLYEASFHQSGIRYAAFYTDARWDLFLARFLALQDR